jgi:RimJ/RimL family protein N-acetyltransferase
MKPPEIITPRLVLRCLDLPDAEAIQRLFPQWEIVRFMSDKVPWPYPSDGAVGFITDAISAMQSGTEWHWTIRPTASTEDVIGAISLMDRADDNRGFWLAPLWQGRGLMTEACKAVTDFWFDTLKRPVLRVPKAAANVRSRRISERTGMRMVKTETRGYVSGRLPAEIWEITAEEWRIFRGA